VIERRLASDRASSGASDRASDRADAKPYANLNAKASVVGAHGGYHWRSAGQGDSRFFEGWYFRLTLSELGQTFAFMYSIDDPAGGRDLSGGAAQILGPGEDYFCRTFADVTRFWAWPHRLGLGHWRGAASQIPSMARYLRGDRFESTVLSSPTAEGYQVTEHLHQGLLRYPSGQVKARWSYEVTPVSGWGNFAQLPGTARATAGWLSYLPIFEPGWQVLMSHGLAKGWVEWQSLSGESAEPLTRYEFDNAPVYAEKNWGGAFPAKWFWIQCNAFADFPGLSITAAVGIREVLVFKEDVGLIGLHYDGQYYEFFSTKTTFTWQVSPWGRWQVSACSDRYRILLTGQAVDEGAWVRVPTQSGLQFLCRDTTRGRLRVQLWDCLMGDSLGRGEQADSLILDATSTLAGLEVGGGPWQSDWVKG
jgi:tocopherol cyclase